MESVEQAEDWRLEKISFDAAYGGERVTAYLFLPKRASPPFQVVVYFPDAAAAHMRSSPKGFPIFLPAFDFIIKSGRAVLFPIYKGTFERGGGPKPIYWPDTAALIETMSSFGLRTSAGRSITLRPARISTPTSWPTRVTVGGQRWGDFSRLLKLASKH